MEKLPKSSKILLNKCVKTYVSSFIFAESPELFYTSLSAP